MDEFLILLQAKLDEAKSKGNVNADINKLQNQLDKLKVQVELDPKATQRLADNIGKLINQKIVISNIDVDTKSATKYGQDYGKQFSKGLSQELKNNNSKLATFKKSLENIGMGSKEIDTIANKINNLGVQIETLNQARSSGKKDILSVNIAGIDQYGQAIKLTQQYNIATGKLVNAIDAVSTAQQGIGNNTNSIKKAENVFADYTAKMEQFKSTNSNILSGLSDPLSDFENKLSGLKNGSASIDDVVNSYKNLNSEASKITSNLSAQFNKVDSAVRNIAKGDETIASLRADFKGLSNAPKEVNSELSKCEKLLLNVKNIEIQEGRTVNWSAAYKEWEQSLDSLKAKIATLKKEQSNVASSQIFNTKDLDSQGKIYIQKVNNTIEKTKAELESKLRNAGYMDIQIKGTEDAAGKIKSLTATVTDATGAFKQLNFERAKIQNSGKAQAGFVQTDDVKVIGNISSSIGKVQSNLSSLKTKWEEQGVLVGEFKTKVEQLESSLSSIGSKGELNSLKTQIQDLKSEASTIAQVYQIQLSMDNGHGASEYQNRINTVTASLEKYGVEAQEVKNITTSLQSTFDSMKGLSGQELVTQADKLEQEFKAVKASVEQAKVSYDKYMQPVPNEKATSLINRINSFLTKNTKITTEAKVTLQGYVDELGKGVNLNRWNEINGILKKTENSMRGLGLLGASLKDQMTQAAQSFTQWLSVSSGIMLLVSKAKNAVSELKEVNTLLTEISKANDSLSKSDLSKIGSDSFNIASKYGKTATSYLSGVQEASRAGYENAMGIAELSVAAQGAGDMTAKLSNQMIIAVDKAYKMNGSIAELTKVLDGMNFISNHNAVNMTELSEAMSIVGSTAASFGVDVDETTAALGTMSATTQQSGSEVARAFKAILLNIRQVSDEEEGIDAEGLTKYENACNALNVKLKETKDGVLSLRDPMEVLRDLSVEYNKLEESDIRRTNLLSSIGGKLRATQLDALLRQWDTYETMLQQYANGTGSMAVEAEKTTNSWEGSMNRLSNTWTDTIGNIANSDVIITAINGLNGILSVVNSITDTLGSFGTISTTISAIAGAKGLGLTNYNYCYI